MPEQTEIRTDIPIGHIRIKPGMTARDLVDAAEAVSEKDPFLVILEHPLLTPDATRRKFAHDMIAAHKAYRELTGFTETDADLDERGVLFVLDSKKDMLGDWGNFSKIAIHTVLGWAEHPGMEKCFVRQSYNNIKSTLLFAGEVEVKRTGPYIRKLSVDTTAETIFSSVSDACFGDAVTLHAMSVSKELARISHDGSNIRLKSQFQRFGILLGLARRIISISCGENSPQKEAFDAFCTRVEEININRIEKLVRECRSNLGKPALTHVEDQRLLECAGILGIWKGYLESFADAEGLNLPDKNNDTLLEAAEIIGLDSAISAYLDGVPYEAVLPPEKKRVI